MQLLLFSSVVVVYENTSAICVVVGFHAVRFFLAFLFVLLDSIIKVVECWVFFNALQ